MRILRLATMAVLLSGCFSDAPPVDDDGGTTTGDACTPGTLGCACGPDGCGPGLECAAGLELCQYEGCDAGSAGCMCLQDDCVGEAVCVGGFCVTPSGTTGMPTSADASADGSDDPSVDDSPDATGLDGTTAADTMSVSDDAVGDSTTGFMCPSYAIDADCGSPDNCMTCVDCVTQTGNCADLRDQCMAHEMCSQILACVAPGCIEPGDLTCVSQCCTTSDCTDDKPGCLVWQALALCVETTCSVACELQATCPSVSCALD